MFTSLCDISVEQIEKVCHAVLVFMLARILTFSIPHSHSTIAVSLSTRTVTSLFQLHLQPTMPLVPTLPPTAAHWVVVRDLYHVPLFYLSPQHHHHHPKRVLRHHLQTPRPTNDPLYFNVFISLTSFCFFILFSSYFLSTFLFSQCVFVF